MATEVNAPPVNDNDHPPGNAIAFSDLALAMGVDEDTLLQRLAGILSKRLEPASEACLPCHDPAITQ